MSDENGERARATSTSTSNEYEFGGENEYVNEYEDGAAGGAVAQADGRAPNRPFDLEDLERADYRAVLADMEALLARAPGTRAMRAYHGDPYTSVGVKLVRI